MMGANQGRLTYEYAELEALGDVRRSDLEEVVRVELLEHRGLDLGEVVGDEEREERVVGAVDGHVDGRDVDEEETGVDPDVDEGEHVATIKKRVCRSPYE